MSNQARDADIAAYLADVKRLLSAGKYDFVPRRKNMQALAQHGLSIPAAKNEILGEFKKNIDGLQFYIKVKIVQENGEDILKCIGFHEDDFA